MSASESYNPIVVGPLLTIHAHPCSPPTLYQNQRRDKHESYKHIPFHMRYPKRQYTLKEHLRSQSEESERVYVPPNATIRFTGECKDNKCT